LIRNREISVVRETFKPKSFPLSAPQRDDGQVANLHFIEVRVCPNFARGKRVAEVRFEFRFPVLNWIPFGQSLEEVFRFVHSLLGSEYPVG
jgi:hypothetical protein